MFLPQWYDEIKQKTTLTPFDMKRIMDAYEDARKNLDLIAYGEPGDTWGFSAKQCRKIAEDGLQFKPQG